MTKLTPEYLLASTGTVWLTSAAATSAPQTTWFMPWKWSPMPVVPQAWPEFQGILGGPMGFGWPPPARPRRGGIDGTSTPASPSKSEMAELVSGRGAGYGGVQ